MSFNLRDDPNSLGLYSRFVLWLRRYEERPHYNRLGAGLSAMLWAHWCGHGWRFACRQAAIYWFNRKP
jgi:hypothetical protein